MVIKLFKIREVSFRLFLLYPKISKKNKGLRTNKIVWAGIADNLPDDASADSFENKNFDIVPVNLPPKLNESYYGGFCNDMIWPLFHYFPSYCVFRSDYYKSYYEANSKFCDELIKIIRPGDFIWIHDYQLMLLPENDPGKSA